MFLLWETRFYKMLSRDFESRPKLTALQEPEVNPLEPDPVLKPGVYVL